MIVPSTHFDPCVSLNGHPSQSKLPPIIEMFFLSKSAKTNPTDWERIFFEGVYLPAWPDLAKFRHFGIISKDLFGNCQNFEPSFVNFYSYWANFPCCKWQNIEKVMLSSGHTGTYLPLPTFFSWMKHNLALMLFDLKVFAGVLEESVGTGYENSTPNATVEQLHLP